MQVIHTAIRVSDLDATTAFYEDVLGLDYQWDFTHEGVVNYFVGTEEGAEIQFKYDPDSDAAVSPAGIDHLALLVDDVDATVERALEAPDCSIVSEPSYNEAAGRRTAFVTDPDGYVIEFVQRLE